MKKTAKEIEEIKEIVDKAIEWYYEGNGKWAEIIEQESEISKAYKALGKALGV